MQESLIISFLFISTTFAFGQNKFQPINLVPNPSFEQYQAFNFDGANGHMAFEHDILAWKTANKTPLT